jgi:putative acetyltransferase
VASRDLTIRLERDGDSEAIRTVTASAFPSVAEANLVDALRQQQASSVSLVADDGGQVVGHILFSAVTLDDADIGILGLAPMAVLPGRQRQGIGSELVRAGLDASRKRGAAAVVVVGHPAFYPRFGFIPASRFGLRCEYEVPDDVFMALELRPGVLRTGGFVRYHPAFAEL